MEWERSGLPLPSSPEKLDQQTVNHIESAVRKAAAAWIIHVVSAAFNLCLNTPVLRLLYICLNESEHDATYKNILKIYKTH